MIGMIHAVVGAGRRSACPLGKTFPIRCSRSRGGDDPGRGIGEQVPPEAEVEIRVD